MNSTDNFSTKMSIATAQLESGICIDYQTSVSWMQQDIHSILSVVQQDCMKKYNFMCQQKPAVLIGYEDRQRLLLIHKLYRLLLQTVCQGSTLCWWEILQCLLY